MAVLTEILLVATLYGATGWVGLQFPFFEEYVTLMWPPIGIAVAAVVLRGPRVAPGITLGLLIASWSSPLPVGALTLIAIGNTLGPLLAGWFLRSGVDLRPQLDRSRDAAMYVLVGVLGASLVTASLGTVALGLFAGVPRDALPSAWISWFAGDAAGVLLVGAFLLTWASRPARVPDWTAGTRELVALAVTTIAATAAVLVYGTDVPSLGYLLFPFLAWSSLRFGPRGASTTAVVISAAVAGGMIRGVGPFASASAAEGMASVWIFFSVVGGSGLLITALVGERNEAVIEKQLLMSELDHRVKNTLATVLAVADQTRSSAPDVDGYIEAFGARMRALAHTHEALARAQWRGVDLSEVVDVVLAPYSGAGQTRGTRSGDEVTLSARDSTPLAMALHELATNAAKYGAWSISDGVIDIRWMRGEDGELTVVWEESGGPAVTEPTKPGFGLRVIKRLMSYELDGEADLDFRSTGLVCRLWVPPSMGRG